MNTFAESSTVSVENEILDALRAVFPKVAQLLGADGFSTTVERYLRAYPPTYPSLAQVGRHFPSFLAEPPGPPAEVADLAALEWARCEVFAEAQVRTATPDLVADPEAEQIVLRTVPALRLLSLRYDILPLWKDLEAGNAVQVPRAQPTAVVVWRKEAAILHVRLAAEEALALRRTMWGATVAEVYEAFAEHGDPVQAARAAVASWLAQGWIAAPQETARRAAR